MKDEPSLDGAYALTSPEDNKRLYAKWAQSYDRDFADAMAYALPAAVADAYAALGGAAPVLDIGAGTGLVAEALVARGVAQVDGMDISPEMLAEARKRGLYRALFEADITEALPCADGFFGGAVSAGTFTNGHVGPGALGEVLRVVRPGGWVVISVNRVHWERQGFEDALARLAPMIAESHQSDIAIYGDAASGEHADDRAILLSLRRSGQAA